MSAILSIKNVSKTYDHFQALSDVSLEVREGRIFGLLGPNGAGKTSLIRIVNGITGPDSGDILFNGRPINSSISHLIGYLPEERGLYKKMKVGELCLYLTMLKGLSKSDAARRIRDWFERFEIAGWWHKRVEELSKGMQQKLQFIVAVAHSPQLLILDEPFSGFDPINAALIRKEIESLHRNGTSIILSTHNMASVEEICDDIALIYKSRKILDGSVEDVRSACKENLFDIIFKGELTLFSQALWIDAQLLNHHPISTMTKARVRLLNNKTANDLLKALIPHVEIHGFTEVIPSMNDVFVRRVKEMETEEMGND